MFLLYIKKISVVGLHKRDYFILLPGSLEFSYASVQWFLYEPSEVREFMVWKIYVLGGFVFNIVLMASVVICLTKHLKNNKTVYTTKGKMQLKWTKYVLISVLVSLILLANLQYLGYNQQVYALSYMYDFFLVLSVMYFGYTSKDTIIFTKEKGTSIQCRKELTGVLDKIRAYLFTSEAYLQKDFTTLTLYNTTGITPHKISLALKVIEHKNFNAFINSFRIEKAIQYLKNDAYKKYTIDALGNEVGFISKSAFYAAFKNHTGITPAQYKNQLKA